MRRYTLGAALVSVFIVATGDNWQNIMFAAMDSTGSEGTAPKENANATVASTYFVVVVLSACLFWANLLVSALVDNFNRIVASEQAHGGGLMVSEAQRKWQKALQEALISSNKSWKMTVPKKWPKWRKKLHARVAHWTFESAVVFIIILNTVFLIFQRHGAPQWEVTLQASAAALFTALYCLEALMLIIAMSFKVYWAEPWNRLDFVIAFLLVTEYMLPDLETVPGFQYVFDIARLLRLFKVIRAFEGLRTLVTTLLTSLPGRV